MDEHADVVVLGMGPGGEEVAGRLAEAGLDVVGIEQQLLGGECPYWGCVPSKMMIRAANLLAEARRIPGMAGEATVRADYAPVARRIREEATDTWDDRVAVERFEGKGGRFVRGIGRVAGPHSVTVDGRTITARRALVIATGTTAVIPPIRGLDATPYWTNREAIEAEQPPKSVHAGVPATSVAHDGRVFAVTLAAGSRVDGERLLVAAGRRADLRAVGVATAGLDESARWLAVDDCMRAGDGIWAVGDLTGKGAFTHVAMYQAAIAVADILGLPTPSADYRAVPRVTFTDPEVGSVGLTERTARERGIAVRTGVAQVPSSARGWMHKAGNAGFIKLVEDSARGVLVGAISAGPVGGEVLGMLTLAVHAEVPVESLRHMIYAYPTFHRAVEDALRDLAGD